MNYLIDESNDSMKLTSAGILLIWRIVWCIMTIIRDEVLLINDWWPYVDIESIINAK